VFPSPDGKLFATQTPLGDRYRLTVWDAVSGEERHRLHERITNQCACSFSRDGRRVLAIAEDAGACVWNTDTGQRLMSSDEVHKRAVLSGNGRTVFVVTAEGQPCMLDAETGRELKRLDGTIKTMPGLLFLSDDGRWAMTEYVVDDRLIAAVWDTTSGRRCLELPVSIGTSLSKDGRRLLSIDADGIGRLREVSSGKELALFNIPADEIKALRFSRDDRFSIVMTKKGLAQLWDTNAGTPLQAFRHLGPVIAGDLSPNGRFLATVSWNEEKTDAPKMVRLWDVRTGDELIRHPGRWWWLDFLDDDRLLLRGAGEAKVMPVDVVAAARARQPRELTDEERREYEVP
jgi:WD40 repeat protein